ncbi:glyoxalase [Paenibacillus marchantiophytorum]|uniref:Glyoxalase n=1 Tax=Paenibacillus marchantiophytorum TaxID=1619310 RepID=A0ABQ1EVP7_9BACL|nr:VOC family protein [Paenibacillus marchantiophytorum]GFZ88822.1 glyoxalase [Paenibacillus marchantiophytorum]
MSYAILGIDHVQLAAPEGCEQVAREFFADLLGWKEIAKPESLKSRGGVWFACGTHQLHVGVQKDFMPAAKAHPAFAVMHLAALREHLVAHNLTVVDDAVRADEGIQRFYLHDPFGNRLEFLEYGQHS